jgi:hypothetical protein
MPRREDHEVHKDMGGIGLKKSSTSNMLKTCREKLFKIFITL